MADTRQRPRASYDRLDTHLAASLAAWLRDQIPGYADTRTVFEWREEPHRVVLFCEGADRGMAYFRDGTLGDLLVVVLAWEASRV